MFHLPQELVGQVFSFDSTFREVYDNVMLELSDPTLAAMLKMLPQAKTIKYLNTWFMVEGQTYKVVSDSWVEMGLVDYLYQSMLSLKLMKKVVIMGEDYYIYQFTEKIGITRWLNESSDIKIWNR
ncbi:MAG: hypothetical protein EBU96_10350 [Actinobacteria bacterium]|nr:hypothetical protein [Actinomycetota bacterium]